MLLFIDIFLIVLGAYFLIGLLFGLYFVFLGAVKLDPQMGDSRWAVRLILFPGCVAVWPFLLFKLSKSKKRKR